MFGEHDAALVAAGRLAFAEMVASLDPHHQSTATLCEGWGVHRPDGPHGAAVRHHVPRFALASLRHRQQAGTVGAVTRHLARRPLPELLAELRAHARTRVAPRRVGPEAQLVQTAVHLRDLARPLGLSTDVPLVHWRMVLAYLVSPGVVRGVMPRGRVDGLALRATDLDWDQGRGAELTGTSEALAMALCGRPVALDDLGGPGRDLLAGRLS